LQSQGIPLTPRPRQILDNQAVLVRTQAKEGHNAVQVGAINHPRPHNVRGGLRSQPHVALLITAVTDAQGGGEDV
jgi:hypothetical protein